MRATKLLAGLLALALAWAPLGAFAQPSNVIGAGIYGDVKRAGATYVGPGDIVSGATAWYSCARAYNAAYAAGGANKLCNLRNTSTSETCDELVQPSGLFGAMASCSGSSNGLPLATFCATGCAVTEMYDQTGNGRPLLQATAANQPALSLLALGTFPAATTSASAMGMASSGTIGPAAGAVTFEVVGLRSSTANSPLFLRENGGSPGNQIRPSSSTNTWLTGATASITATAADATWHSGIGVINGASSFLSVDGTSTTGTVAKSTSTGTVNFSGQSATTRTGEVGFWDAIAFSTANATAECQNAQAFYGSTNFGATC